MRTGRERTFNTYKTGGSLVTTYRGNPAYTNTGDANSVSFCRDLHGRPVSDGDLLIEKTIRHTPDYVSGVHTSGSWTSVANSWISSGYRSLALTHLKRLDLPPASSEVSRVLAGTNPSRPVVTPLTLIQDLVDLPRMLRRLGRIYFNPKEEIKSAKDLADYHLMLKFGIIPLVHDITLFLNLSSHISRRIDEINRLWSKGGLRRRINLGNWSFEGTSNVQMSSLINARFQSRRQVFTTFSRWGTVRWLPTDPPSQRPNSMQTINLARKTVLGLTEEGSLRGLWDFLPWTWLIDWCSNVSDYLTIHSNTIPALPGKVNIMTHGVSKYTFTPLDLPSGFSGGIGASTYETKERYVGSGSISVSIPFIGMDRLSILTSLSVQRFKLTGR